ncbi:MAG: response regulator transcription factor [Chitinophagaceae bacterium]|nr:response regulator transcription factor [Chitinophagaceae bacterium]
MQKIKLIVVDDHPMVLEGLRSMFAQIAFVDLLATCTNAYEAIEAIKKQNPDIVITDINMPEVSGIDLATKIKKEYAGVKIIAMSTFNERSYVTQMIQNGSDGYLVKNATKEEIEEAILSVFEGKMYMSVNTNMSTADKKEISNIPVISSREKGSAGFDCRRVYQCPDS